MGSFSLPLHHHHPSVCRDPVTPAGPALASDGPTNYQIICPGMLCKLQALALRSAFKGMSQLVGAERDGGVCVRASERERELVVMRGWCPSLFICPGGQRGPTCDPLFTHLWLRRPRTKTKTKTKTHTHTHSDGCIRKRVHVCIMASE